MFRTIGLGFSTGILIAFLAHFYRPETTSFWFSNRSDKERLENVLKALVWQEQSVQIPDLSQTTSPTKPRIAIGFGACHDLFVDASFMFSGEDPPDTPEHVNDITTYAEFQSVFTYFFQHGAAAEYDKLVSAWKSWVNWKDWMILINGFRRFVPDDNLFERLVAKAEKDPAHRYALGGNAPVMALRFAQEGAEILLAGRMTQTLQKVLPPTITLAGSDNVDKDDIHLILEYKRNQVWQQYQSPRANR